MASSWSGLTQGQESQIPPFAEVNPGWNPVGGGYGISESLKHRNDGLVVHSYGIKCRMSHTH